MKRILISISIMAALVACTKEQNAITAESDRILATAADFRIDDTQTRTIITQEGNSAPKFAWKEGDVIGVIPMDGKTVQSNYTISSIDTDPKTATFDGGVWALKDGKGYAAYYPYKKEAVQSGESLEFSFMGQKQSANNSLSHIGDYDYMYAATVVASSSATSFSFKHLVSLVRFQITVPKTDQYTNLAIGSTVDWFVGKTTLSLNDGTMAPTQKLKTYNISLNDIEVSSGEVLTVWLSMLPTSALNGGSISLKLTGADSFSTATILNVKNFEAGKAYSFSCTAKEDTGYVDLGLSVKWATCNIGATSPEGYGDYYAWGEIETKSNYSLNTYKYYNSEYEGGIEKKGYTKYVPQSQAAQYGFKGFYDDKTTLEPDDDVAHVLLGGNWRIPTDSELTELRTCCTWQWVTYKEIKGYKVTSNKEGYTDKWIFLPASGSCQGQIPYVGYNGAYWSSSLLTDYSYYAWFMDLGPEAAYKSHLYRYYGFSVRPVTE